MNKQELIEKYEYMSHACFRRVDTLEVLKDLRQLDEPKKVKVPQFVADLLEFAKLNDWDLEDVFEDVRNEHSDTEISEWFYQKKNMDILARAWLDGYEVEKEKRYIVTLKSSGQKLYYHTEDEDYIFSSYDGVFYSEYHTKTDLEENDMSWVFDCEGVEVEEVE